MKRIAMIMVAVMLVLGFGMVAVSQDSDFVEEVGPGELDWSSGVITVTGDGAPNPKAPTLAVARKGCVRAAQVDAYRNLLETVKGVRVDSATLVENFMTTQDVIATRVQGVVKGARVKGKPKYFDDGGCQVTIIMKITGQLTDILLPDDIGQKAQEIPKAPVPPVYTGLIIDATGLGAQPAMSPKIIDENGMEIYGSAYVDRDFAVKMGIAGYARTIDQAKKNDRVSGNPLVIKGKKISGDKNADVVIANTDAQTLKDASQNLSFLKDCKVIIVID